MRAILLILGGLAALIALIGFGGGFILGDRHPVRGHLGRLRTTRLPADLLIGARCSAVVIFLLFDKLLTLSPARHGPLERLL